LRERDRFEERDEFEEGYHVYLGRETGSGGRWVVAGKRVGGGGCFGGWR